MQFTAAEESRQPIPAEVFRAAAEKVSAVVGRVSSLEEALDYTVNLCAQKEACQLLMAGCEAPLSREADDLCRAKQQKTIAAPCLAPALFAALEERCRISEIKLIGRDLRKHLAGIDIGFTVVDYGIAETGTLVLDSSSEDLRLATMVSEIHVAVLPLSRLKATAFDLQAELADMMAQALNYLAFITGASRTADIERVLALGVHGPLEVHILLWEDR
jgi:L-lactate dehydrogenase complex protein LldG